MSGVSLTWTIMYTKPLFVSYPPNIQAIICGKILGGEPKSTPANRRASQWLSSGISPSGKWSLKRLVPARLNSIDDLLTALEAPVASWLAAVSHSDALIVPLQRLPSRLQPHAVCSMQPVSVLRKRFLAAYRYTQI